MKSAWFANGSNGLSGDAFPMLAECLGWAQVSGVNALETDGSSFKAWRDVGQEPALISGGPVVFMTKH